MLSKYQQHKTVILSSCKYNVPLLTLAFTAAEAKAAAAAVATFPSEGGASLLSGLGGVVSFFSPLAKAVGSSFSGLSPPSLADGFSVSLEVGA